MVLQYETATGTPVEQRNARRAHRIVIPAEDKAAGLAKMAPQVFTLDAAGNATCDIGQIASLLLASVVRLPPAGYPAKLFMDWRIKVEAISRFWITCLGIIHRRSNDELASLQLSPNGPSRQRGEVICALRALRQFANAAQLAAFEIQDADFERIDAGDKCAPHSFKLCSADRTLLRSPKTPRGSIRLILRDHPRPSGVLFG